MTHRKPNPSREIMKYQIETFFNKKWIKIHEGSLHYCWGYIDGRSNDGPRPQLRIVREGGKVVDILEGREDVNIGMVAGFPTAEQYERAGNKALERARTIRELQAQHDARRANNTSGATLASDNDPNLKTTTP